MTVPTNVTLAHYPRGNKFATWESVALVKNGKTFMLFNSPYEIIMPIPFKSIVVLNSKSLGKIYRVTASELMADTQFRVGYATSDSIYSKETLNNSWGSNTYSSSAGYPLVLFDHSKTKINYIGSYCSIDQQYWPICDSVMDTISITRK